MVGGVISLLPADEEIIEKKHKKVRIPILKIFVLFIRLNSP
jgi:hypothetical protein